jgi:DNA-binding response OmpR family regulator
VGYGPNIPPVVFITAFGDEELHEQAHHAGALAVLDKPLDIDELRVFVNNFLARKGT